MDVNLIRGSASLTRTADAYAGTLSVGDTAYMNRGIYFCKIDVTNTTAAPTLNINSVGAKSIYGNDGSSVPIGSLKANGWYAFIYDSSVDRFIVVNTAVQSASASFTKTFANKAARDASVPDFNGQYGTQLDIDATFQSTGTSAGNWNDTTPVGRIFYADSTRGHTASQGATGSISNPFSTITEAISAANALTPSATSRYLVKAYGIFTEGLILKNYVDVDLSNSILDCQAGASTYTIDDNNTACNSTVYGNGRILRTTAGTGGCVRVQNSSSAINIIAHYINDDIGVGVSCVNGQLFVKTLAEISSSVGIAISQAAGICSIDSYSVSGATYGSSMSGGTQYIRVLSNVNGGSNYTLSCSSGTMYFRGNISAGLGVTCSGGTQTLYSDVSVTSGIAALCSSGSQTIYGNLTTSSSTASAASCSGGTQIVRGNVSHTNASGGAASNGALCSSSGSQYIYGNISTVSTNASSYGVRTQTSGTCEYQGDISSAGGGGLHSSGSGTVRLKFGSKVSTTKSGVYAIQKPSGTDVITIESVTIVAVDTGSIEGTTTPTIKLRGYSQANIAEGSGVAFTGGGSFNVDSTVD